MKQTFVVMVVALAVAVGCQAPVAPARADPLPTAAEAAGLKELLASQDTYLYRVQMSGLEESPWLCRLPEVGAQPSASPPGPGINYHALVEVLGVLKVEPGGPLTVMISRDKARKPYKLCATDTASAVFVLKHILPPDKQAEWLDKLAKEPTDIAPMTMEEAFRPLEGATELAADSPDARAVLPQAKRIYDERRPALIRKFHLTPESWLFYPPAEKAGWTCYRKDEVVIARAWCNDLMYAANFYFEFRLDPEGRRRCTRIAGGEFFKGE
jgi:hypothetical protein